MNTEDQIDSTITALKVISMVQKNGRLSIRKGQLTLEPDDHLTTFRRWFFKDSRDHALMHIKNTINNAINLSRGIIEKKIDTELKSWSVNRLATEMQNCQSGLTNLKTTYNEDPLFKASIDVLNDRLQEHCKELMKHYDEKDKVKESSKAYKA
jgi:hypothetical protein